MTRYTVSWRPEIEADLADIWSVSPDKKRVAVAANHIDVELSRDADSKGVEVHEGLRALVVEPLVVHFSVMEADRMATVWAVRRTDE